jgi:hypothetical protein
MSIAISFAGLFFSGTSKKDLADFLRDDNSFFSKFCEIIFICTGGFLYKPMHPEPFYDPTDFRCAEALELPDVFVPTPIDIELALQNSKQLYSPVFCLPLADCQKRNMFAEYSIGGIFRLHHAPVVM